MHACAIAEALGMRAVVVPPRAGVFSAAGLLCAPKSREVVQSLGRILGRKRPGRHAQVFGILKYVVFVHIAALCFARYARVIVLSGR